jgi:predicted phage replisome organizer
MADDKKYFYIKMPQGYLDDPRIKKLRKIAGGDTYTIIYLKLQLFSLPNGGIITFEGIEETFEEELALKIDENVEDIKITLAFLAGQNLIEGNKNDYLLTEAASRIGSETDSAERMRIFRAKQKTQKQLTAQSANNVQGSDAILRDIDRDKYRDKDIDRSKEGVIGGEKVADAPTPKRFIKPTVEEIRTYCNERNNGIDPERFFDFYESKGWLIGKNPMKDWKAAIRTWEQRDNPKPKKEDKPSVKYTKGHYL